MVSMLLLLDTHVKDTRLHMRSSSHSWSVKPSITDVVNSFGIYRKGCTLTLFLELTGVQTTNWLLACLNCTFSPSQNFLHVKGSLESHFSCYIVCMVCSTGTLKYISNLNILSRNNENNDSCILPINTSNFDRRAICHHRKQILIQA